MSDLISVFSSAKYTDNLSFTNILAEKFTYKCYHFQILLHISTQVWG